MAGSVQPSQERWNSLPWKGVCCSCLSGLFSVYAARKDPKDLTLLASRRLCTVRKRVRSNLVLMLLPRCQRKLVPRNTVTFATSMGAHTGHTVLEIAVDSKKMEEKKSNFHATKKCRKKPNPTKQFSAQLSKKID
jgi:hypothetical protein